LYFIVLLYFQKYKTRKVTPETMYVLHVQKYKKTITFSMLGEPGLYFLYFLRYLGCVGRMVLVCHYTAALVDASVLGVRQQKVCIMSGWKQTCALPVNNASAPAAARHVSL
jgi:hypothetical protein